MKQKIEESLSFIRSTTDIIPEGLVILGTGLSGAIDGMDEAVTIPYSQIPHFPTTSATTHKGELIIGTLKGYPLAVMHGRVHYYEGYDMDEVTYPVRILNYLGVRTMVVSNAAGALNIDYRVGDIVILSDHINLMGVNPLRGIGDEETGSRFPLMTQAYDPELSGLFGKSCVAEKLLPRHGIYVAVSGPSLETPAELRFLHTIGGDLVGMSTVPEVIVANHLGIRVLGVSIVSNQAEFLPQEPAADTIERINRTAKKAAGQLRKILRRFFAEINKQRENGR